jgi:hypothetical protein
MSSDEGRLDDILRLVASDGECKRDGDGSIDGTQPLAEPAQPACYD